MPKNISFTPHPDSLPSEGRGERKNKFQGKEYLSQKNNFRKNIFWERISLEKKNLSEKKNFNIKIFSIKAWPQ